MSAPAGPCFGYAIESPLAFEFLRGGTGVPLRVDAGETCGDGASTLLFDWPAVDEQPQMRLFENGSTYRYWVDGGGSFVVDCRAQRITIPAEAEPLRREERLWGLPLLLCFAARGDLPLHAAAVEVADGAVVIAGPRTFGKTTLVAGAHAAGHRVLTEDIACIRLGGDEPQVIPGPAMLRLRRDVASRLPLDGAKVVRSDGQRVHLSLAADRRGTCDGVALRGIVLLREGPDVVLERAPAAAAVRDLWQLNFRFRGAAPFGASVEALVDLAREIPVWNLFRPLRLDTLAETVAVLAHV